MFDYLPALLGAGLLMAAIGSCICPVDFCLCGYTTREVIDMKYHDLTELLEKDLQAKIYFNKLPDYVRDQIRTRSGNVNSFDSLKDYAENLTRGDG
jgi:hypothetical protein